MKDTLIYLGECKECSKETVKKINVERFITKLDSFFAHNDLQGATKHLFFWEKEARNLGDNLGLLTILNESIGFYRRTNDKEMALSALNEALKIINDNGLNNSVGAATIYVNAATTLKSFGNAKDCIDYFTIAEEVYEKNGKKDYDYAALLNNKAAAFCDLKMYDEAKEYYFKAIEILNEEGKHDGDIAITYVSLAQLVFSEDSSNVEKIEEYLDLSWEFLNSQRQVRDWSYAFVLTKCAPAFRFFKRKNEAKALEAVAREIYGRR